MSSRCRVLERLRRRCWLFWVLSTVTNWASRWRFYPCFFREPPGIISCTYLWVWAPHVWRGVVFNVTASDFCVVVLGIQNKKLTEKNGLLFQGLRKKKHEHWEVICSKFSPVFTKCFRSKHSYKLEINSLFPHSLNLFVLFTLSFRTFGEMSDAEEQYSLCRDLCHDLAQDLQRGGLKVPGFQSKKKLNDFHILLCAETCQMISIHD